MAVQYSQITKGQNKPYNEQICFNGGETVIFHKAIWNTEKCAYRNLFYSHFILERKWEFWPEGKENELNLERVSVS